MHARCTLSIKSNKGKRASAEEEFHAAQPLSVACGTAACNMGKRAFADEEFARHSSLRFRSHAAQPLTISLARSRHATPVTRSRAAQPLAFSN